jgi:phosphatidylserine/phosphatidylglycerophosphate/cardiolipin synthase-like enzyme
MAVALTAIFSVQIVASTNVTPLFSPADKPTKKLIELIGSARSSIHAAIYMLTDKTVAEALIKAHNDHHVDVQIILDPISVGQYGKADMLATNNIPVFIFDPTKNGAKTFGDNKWPTEAIMHNKFAIIDGFTVWTGSFNWTNSANRLNSENVVFFNDTGVAKQFEAAFNQLVPRSVAYAQYPGNKASSSLREKVAQALAKTHDDTELLNSLLNVIQQCPVAEID